MRIAIDLTSLAHHYSGIEQYAHRITREMVQQGKDHEFVLLFENEVFRDLVHEVGLPNTQALTTHPQYRHRLYTSQVSTTSALRHVDADVYLFPAFPQPLTFHDPRAVSVIHDVSFWDCPDTLTRASRLYWRTSATHTARQELLVTVSEFSRGRIHERLGVALDKVAVVPNGIDQSFRIARAAIADSRIEELRDRYHLPPRFILSLCTLEPRKNLSQLIDAWVIARTKASGDEVADLVLAGRRGWKVDELLSDVPEQLREHIHLTGFVDNDDLPTLYHSCERFVCASRYEGFGLPPLEALASGAHVLCSDIEVFHETCDDLVTFFALDDANELAALLSAPLQQPTPEQVEALCARYDWKHSAAGMLDTLERHVASNH